MENTRFMQGMEQLKAIDGKGGENVIRSLEDIAPDLGKFIIEFAFGDIYTRQGLTTAERELITLSSLLTAGGCEPQLEVHINSALNVEITPERIIETFLQCIPYTGFPKVLNAVFVAKKVFAEGYHVSITLYFGMPASVFTIISQISRQENYYSKEVLLSDSKIIQQCTDNKEYTPLFHNQHLLNPLYLPYPR